ncbi:extracellular solute-binding protein family 1 [Cellulomonas flavigena DSM 20109]|uniref:Extracellular solute-binding protein family 1 n=1 Tax=Cellulomonas flavigena (strain ATCC 482 / DSM 20109 / BCRC 11376 / JCM 18109 / NBRC 3775 / NCIMB 8073 / NRS 134) TaxID=446466 RepID=D5UHZ1_CELFN|nr:sugar ABC transporter substrate-binding protein [Cellulomonas flavigena]ADG73415.1 extracellular solute-binding protein family 1 [Cellulomonas flavigena DSM 20109]
MKLRHLAAASVPVLLLAACSSGGDAADDGPVTLTYWASNQGTSLDHDKEVLTPVLEDFTERTGVEVDLEVIGWSDLQTRIQTAVTSGQAPDVVNIGNTWAVSLQATGAFLPLDDAAMDAIGGADKFVATALETGGAPGTDPTSVPLYGLAYGLYYNTAMFADAGLQPPTTWEEMVAAAQALTDPAAGVYGMALAAGSYTENNHFAFINATQNGAELFDADGNPTFTGDGVVDGIVRYLDLMQDAGAVNPANAQYDNASFAAADFANGKAAMILNQSNAGATIEANGMAPDAYGVVPFPAPQDAVSDVASHVAGINVSVFGNTEHPDEALQLVEHLTSADVQTTLGRPFSSLPVLKDATAAFTDDAELAAIFTEIYNERSAPLPLVPAEDQFETTVGKAMNAMFATIATGGTVTADDVREAMQTAQDQVQASVG